MTKPVRFLDVEIRTLPEMRVIHHYCLFRSPTSSPDKAIRSAFQRLREQVTLFGFDPQTLLHVGVPELIDGQLVSYDCCIEFPFPEEIEGVKLLPGGRYAVLTIEKVPAKIGPAIRQLHSDYLPEHELIPDEDRPIYEVYFEDLLEYCVPIL